MVQQQAPPHEEEVVLVPLKKLRAAERGAGKEGSRAFSHVLRSPSCALPPAGGPWSMTKPRLLTHLTYRLEPVLFFSQR